MPEISPSEDPDVHQALIALMDRADRLEQQLEDLLQHINQLEERMAKIEDM